MTIIKVQNNTATRAPLPAFLQGLAPESLLDLSWTDPALGVHNLAWWPEENGDGPLPEGYKWGAETLTVDAERRVVVVTHDVVAITPEESAAAQFELDKARYQKRAAVKDELIAYMAADNMSRVRSGAWSVADLTGLMSDPALAAANAYMATLSYELAAQAIAGAATPLLTPAIRADWISKLQSHFYLVP